MHGTHHTPSRNHKVHIKKRFLIQSWEVFTNYLYDIAGVASKLMIVTFPSILHKNKQKGAYTDQMKVKSVSSIDKSKSQVNLSIKLQEF